jgi:hypothetical protein
VPSRTVPGMVLIVVPSYSLTPACERRGAPRPGPLTGTRDVAPAGERGPGSQRPDPPNRDAIGNDAGTALRTIALMPPAIRKEDPWNDATAGR